jgi:hypothetical protein
MKKSLILNASLIDIAALFWKQSQRRRYFRLFPCFSTSTSKGCKRDESRCELKLPNATWSIASLELHKNHKPIDYNELKTLAKRAVIDISIVTADTSAPHQQENIDCLRQDVGNMMNMIQQVVNQPSEIQNLMDDLTCEDLYDVPRGVISAPLRQHTDKKDGMIANESERVWTSFLKPKMISKGGHSYFEIATSRKQEKRPHGKR